MVNIPFLSREKKRDECRRSKMVKLEVVGNKKESLSESKETESSIKNSRRRAEEERGEERKGRFLFEVVLDSQRTTKLCSFTLNGRTVPLLCFI